MIENRLFLQHFRNAFVVRFHSRPELVGTWSEGIIALDLSGAITAVDRNALFQLGCKGADDLINARLERVFDISLPALVERSHKRSFHPLPIHEARHRGRFFAVAQEPESGQRRPGTISIAARADASPPNARRGALDELDLGDPLMARNIRAAKRFASRDAAILLIGETGTGKEVFARALHAAGDDADRAFVAVNCASIPETSLEAALSKIVQTHGGTLFLDEIGELPRALQGRLLPFLEERAVTSPGSTAPIRADVRLVCATRCDLDDKVRRGEFREDLYYRLQGLVLTLPRLQEREDKRALVRQVFAQETAEAPSVSLGEDLVDALCACQWPGNIRQLRNALRAMIARRSGDRLGVTDLPRDYGVGPAPAEPPVPLPENVSLNALARAQRDALLRELQLEGGNLSHVARKLGVSRNTLYRKMHRLGIALPVRKGLH
jgi:transcriptional regulator of acetoin/glycerol metabolism